MFFLIFSLGIFINIQSQAKIYDEPLEILFIGNSYSSYHNLPQILQDLALSSGKNIYVDIYAPGGKSLYEHSLDNNTILKIKEKKWDFIILQGTARRIAYPQYFNDNPIYKALFSLKNFIKSNCKSTRIIFFMPWADEDGMTWIEGWTENFEELQIDVYTKSLEFAQTFNLTIAPIGWVWYHILDERNYPLHYLHSEDWNHPTIEGAYVTACTLFSTIFIESSIGLSFHSELEENLANEFQSTAGSIVLNDLDLWNITPYIDSTFADTTSNDSISTNILNQKETFWSLNQNYPNPFRSFTKITYEVIKESDIKIEVYSTTGSKVAILVDEKKLPGIYSVDFDGNYFVNGIYMYSLKANDYFQTRKMHIIK